MELDEKLEVVLDEIKKAEAVILGVGPDLSRAYGVRYDSKNTNKRLDNSPEEYWPVYASQEKSIIERDTPTGFNQLADLLKDKSCHVLTTSQDGLIARAFGSDAVTHMSGDWGALQCSRKCHDELYDAAEYVDDVIAASSVGSISRDDIPKCPKCGELMQPWVYSFNFLEGARHKSEYDKWNDFLKENINSRILFLAVGLGQDQPEFIKMPFWHMAQQHPNCFHATIESERAFAPGELDGKSVVVEGRIPEVLNRLEELVE